MKKDRETTKNVLYIAQDTSISLRSYGSLWLKCDCYIGRDICFVCTVIIQHHAVQCLEQFVLDICLHGIGVEFDTVVDVGAAALRLVTLYKGDECLAQVVSDDA